MPNRSCCLRWGGMLLLACAAAVASHAQAQLRPDAGSLQDPQRLQLPGWPWADVPPIATPPVATPAPADNSVKLTPVAFRVQGNTVFSAETLLGLLQDRVARPASLDDLREAARDIRRYYRDRGYLLTEAYLPEQALPAQGGTVLITVVEARLGTVRVRGDRDSNTTPDRLAQEIVQRHLKPGALISEQMLDTPVLLLRDLAGYDASAEVEPGSRTGEANVTVFVKPAGPRHEGHAGLDNHGNRSAGALRLSGGYTVHHAVTPGDALAVRARRTDISGNTLLKLSYSMLASNLGTRATVDVTRSRYALGQQFAALGATGHATVFSAAVLHPIVRSRRSNLFAGLQIDNKHLVDTIAVGASSDRRITSARVSLLGNELHEGARAGSFTGYGISLTAGRLRMDAASLAIDQGAGGPGTAGGFSKLNGELQHVHFFSPQLSLHAGIQWQIASGSLASAEKMSLGGPAGVRGYPVGEGLGDSGHLIALEARYQLRGPFSSVNWPVSATTFYDSGSVRHAQAPAAGVPTGTRLSSVGFGLLAGQPGRGVVQAMLAWRTSDGLPVTGDPDRRPRWWLSAQQWF